MTSRRIPLGRKESQGLEFKAKDKLHEGRNGIGREVVGMLNAEKRGEIWIGLVDENHRAVRVEGVPEAEVEARSLHDFLVDSLEPAPLSGEVEIQVEESEEGAKVLRIQVQGRAERRPYALLRKGTRYYGVRVKDRLRLMTREEILTPPEDGARDSQDAVIRKVLDERERVLDKEDDLLWLRVEPTQPVELNLQAPLFDELIRDPAVTNNRREGLHFARSDRRPSLGNGRISWDVMSDWQLTRKQRFSVEIRDDGGFEFRLPLNALQAAVSPAKAKRSIHPLTLSECLVSAFRIITTVYSDCEAKPGEVIVDLVLVGLEETVLIRDQRAIDSRSVNPSYSDRLLAVGPLVIAGTQLLNEPDRCGFRLMRKIYEAFGLREEALPREFDRETGRLVLPE